MPSYSTKIRSLQRLVSRISRPRYPNTHGTPLSQQSRSISSTPSISFSSTISSSHQQQQQPNANTTISPDEVAKFSAMANEWWNPHGPFRMLHLMNPPRVQYVQSQIRAHFNKLNSNKSTHTSPTNALPLSNLKILDMGCGGGLLSEALCRLGANVTGVDASEENIKMATLHSKRDPLLHHAQDSPVGSLTYQCTTAEDMVATRSEKFDVVCALEIIEHVASPELFVETLSQLLKPNGVIILSTMNRTALSYFLTIFMAENVLNLVPKGTHEHEKYLKPSEVHQMCINNGLKVVDTSGMAFNPLKNEWWVVEKNGTWDLECNYLVSAVKRGDTHQS